MSEGTGGGIDQTKTPKTSRILRHSEQMGSPYDDDSPEHIRQRTESEPGIGLGITFVDPNTLDRDGLIVRMSEICQYVSHLQNENQELKNTVSHFRNELQQANLDFAEAARRLIHAPSQTQLAAPAHATTELNTTAPVTPLGAFSQVVKGKPSPTIIVKCSESFKSSTATLDVVDDLLQSKSNGPVPISVRSKNDTLFIKLQNHTDCTKAKEVLAAKTSANGSKLSVSIQESKSLYPAVALFVDNYHISDHENFTDLKHEIELRNRDLAGKIDSVKLIYSKPHSKGHYKIFFNCKTTRDMILRHGALDLFNTFARLVEVNLDREVHRYDSSIVCQVDSHIAN
jgi:hypothetical protein